MSNTLLLTPIFVELDFSFYGGGRPEGGRRIDSKKEFNMAVVVGMQARDDGQETSLKFLDGSSETVNHTIEDIKIRTAQAVKDMQLSITGS